MRVPKSRANILSMIFLPKHTGAVGLSRGCCSPCSCRDVLSNLLNADQGAPASPGAPFCCPRFPLRNYPIRKPMSDLGRQRTFFCSALGCLHWVGCGHAWPDPPSSARPGVRRFCDLQGALSSVYDPPDGASEPGRPGALMTGPSANHDTATCTCVCLAAAKGSDSLHVRSVSFRPVRSAAPRGTAAARSVVRRSHGARRRAALRRLPRRQSEQPDAGNGLPW